MKDGSSVVQQARVFLEQKCDDSSGIKSYTPSDFFTSLRGVYPPLLAGHPQTNRPLWIGCEGRLRIRNNLFGVACVVSNEMIKSGHVGRRFIISSIFYGCKQTYMEPVPLKLSKTRLKISVDIRILFYSVRHWLSTADEFVLVLFFRIRTFATVRLYMFTRHCSRRRRLFRC